MSWEGHVDAIYLTSEAAEPLHTVDKVTLVPGLGLEGDRYFLKKGTFSNKPRPGREVTLIEAETIDALRRDYGLDVGAGDARRNVVTRGVPLNHLVGRQFTIGDATLVGIRLCEPCSHLARLNSEDFSNALKHRGGLRAEVVVGAEVHPGDTVREVERQREAAVTR